MFKACSKCGKIHPASFECRKGVTYTGGAERGLRSQYKWTQKSKEIRDRANNLCEVCKDKGVYTYNGLEVHHITKVKNDKSKLLDNLNLVCLCVECHKKADKGLIDENYLRQIAENREKE